MSHATLPASDDDRLDAVATKLDEISAMIQDIKRMLEPIIIAVETKARP